MQGLPHRGVQIIKEKERSTDTPQTSGLLREVAFDSRSTGGAKVNAFLSTVQPSAWTGAHHHGDQDTILYVLSGDAAYAWGDRLENLAYASPGDFVFIPGGVVHQEINPSPDFETRWVVVRSGADPTVFNLPDLDGLAKDVAGRAIGDSVRPEGRRSAGPR